MIYCCRSTSIGRFSKPRIVCDILKRTMPDPRLLAEALAILLAPVLPVLVGAGGKAAGKAVEEVGKQAGAVVTDKVKEIWNRLRGKVEEKEAAQEAATDLAQRPDDKDLQVVFRHQLLKILSADPALAALLEPLVLASTTTQVQVRDQGVLATHGGMAAGPGGVAVGGNVTGGVHVHPPGAAPSPSPDRPDPEATLRSTYLKRLMEQVGVLSLAGIDPAAAQGEAELSLDAVYTGLRTRSGEDVPEVETTHERRALSALEQLNRHRRLVLLGDPGSGKSTFVHFVALCHAGELLGHPQVNLKMLRAPVPGAQNKKQPWKHGALLPVRVVLRDFAARGLPPAGEPVTALHLQTFLATELKEACLGEYVPFLFEHLRQKGGLLLFDGLDEVPEADHHRDRLRQAVEGFVQTFGECRVLLTSRTYAYRNQGWRLGGFAEAELAPFDRAQIESFVRRWYGQVAATGRLGGEEAQGRAQLLLQVVLANERLRGLAERPLLLTLMASLHAWRGGSLPERRQQLYEDAVELLLNLWESHRVVQGPDGAPRLMQPSLAQYLDAGRDQVRQVLEELAFEVHARGDLAGTADVGEGDLVTRLMRLRRKPEANPAQLVEYVSQRAGLLVPRGVGLYTFPHRTFQEYLAACHLTDHGFPGVPADLGRRDPDRWREVVLLAGAKAARGSAFAAWSLADCLCPEAPGAEPSVEDAWGAHLAGQVIAECADLEKVGRADAAKLERLRQWHLHLLRSGQLPARERALAGKTLARWGDPRPEVMTVDGMGFYPVPAGPFRMGEGEEAHEQELAYDFQMARYPVTVAQFQEYVRESSEQSGDAGSLRGLANVPAASMSWREALAFCRWLTARWLASGRLALGWEVTLPSEEEWEKAARGIDGREYPWGEGADLERANCEETGISTVSTVGCFPAGRSPYGCEEMSGNVWEWTRSLLEGRAAREDPTASSPRVLRGGSYGFRSRFVRCAVRYSNHPALRYRDVGFRLVLLPFSSDL